MTSLLRGRGVDVAATLTDAQQALEVVEDAQPDIFVVGVSSATMADISALVRASSPHVRSAVIVLGEQCDPPAVQSILAAGARAYVQKPSI